jgi:histidine ammonia-lyase
LVDKIVTTGDAAYGINTGFGLLAQTRIPTISSSCCSAICCCRTPRAWANRCRPVVRLILALKINALARGHSGITSSWSTRCCAAASTRCIPVIPAQGSVGASGDLAPLAHLSAVLLGIGRCASRQDDAGAEGLRLAGLGPPLRAKEGLALINGTQVSTALALAGLFGAEDVFAPPSSPAPCRSTR